MSAIVIEADNLARHYEVGGGFMKPASTVKALDGVSFQAKAGQTLAIVGESGCGKSTLARLITMIERPTSGRLIIDGKEITEPGAALRQSVQIVFQNPYGSLNPRQKIGYILTEPMLLNNLGTARSREDRARTMLERVGLRPEHYDRYPHMFSGGQRQRIAIARALMLEPKILVLDEPVSALDVSIQAQVLNILVELQEELGLTYLFISHDLSVVRHMADDIMVMYLGRAVEYGKADTIFAHPCHPYSAALLSATPVANPAHAKKRIRLEGELPSPLNPPLGCAFHPRCWLAQSDCQSGQPPMMNDRTQHACRHPLTAE